MCQLVEPPVFTADNMVSLVTKTPSSAEAGVSAPRLNENQAPAKEKESRAPGTPKKTRKDGVIRPSQDAELKDYVCSYISDPCEFC